MSDLCPVRLSGWPRNKDLTAADCGISWMARNDATRCDATPKPTGDVSAYGARQAGGHRFEPRNAHSCVATTYGATAGRAPCPNSGGCVRLRRIPSYRRHSARDLGFAEHRGRRVYFPGRYDSAKSRMAYQAWLAKLLTPSEPNVAGAAVTPVPLVVLADQYLSHAATRYDSREYGCLWDALQPLLAMHGETLTTEFGPVYLERVRLAMVAGYCDGWKASKKRWSRSYVNHQIGRLVRMFAWGVRKQIVPPDIHAALKAVPGLRSGECDAPERPRIQPVPCDHVAAVAAVMPPTLAAMVTLQSLTGMRSANLVQLRGVDIDRSGAVWRYVPTTHKSQWRGRGLVVFLGPRSQGILSPLLDRPETEYLFSPRDSADWRSAQKRAARKTPVQPSQQNRRTPRRRRPLGDCYTVASYRRAVDYAVRLVNAQRARDGLPPIPRWHPHQLRHNVGTAARNVGGIEGARVYLGHASAGITEIYAEADLTLAEQIAAKIG